MLKTLLAASLLLLTVPASSAASLDPDAGAGTSGCVLYVGGQCLLTVYQEEDGSVCFYFSTQPDTCTPDVIDITVGDITVCSELVGQCLLTVYQKDNGHFCFYFSLQTPTCTDDLLLGALSS